MLKNLKQELLKLKNPEKAKILQRFFKTGKGQYGEGDIFLGIKMGEQRAVAKKYIDLKLEDIQKLLDSKVHEHRMVALLILVYKYKSLGGTPRGASGRRQIYNFYIKNAKKINNWDLVDVSAPHMVGDYLWQTMFRVVPCKVPRGSAIKPIKKEKNKKQPNEILYRLARSNNLWERRISIISTSHFIRNNDFKDTIKIAKILLNDKHDLIHKAVGWMLREMGKRDEKELIKFLDKYTTKMPRTMLRYAIERLEEKTRKAYLTKK